MGKKICRFGFPIPPMRQAMILEPLESDTPKEIVKNNQNNLQKIRTVMQSLVKDEDMPFVDFLKKCDLSDETNILAIRSGLYRKQVFLKRNVKDVRISAYNIGILRT